MAADVKGLKTKNLGLSAGIRRYEFTTHLGILGNRLSEIESERLQPSLELLQRIIRVIKDIPNVGREDK